MTLATNLFDYVRELVRAESSIVLDAGKEYLVNSRLAPVAKATGFASADALVEKLMSSRDPELKRQVVEAMTTNETSFLRDRHPFDALADYIVPELIASRASAKQLNIWCAACSTGQEPYTIAMILRANFPELAQWRIRILATDLSEDVLSKARKGYYSQIEVNRGLPAPYLVSFFKKDGVGWQIDSDVQRLVEFRQMNLCNPWPAMPQMDIIFLRNVLIYFDPEIKRGILSAMTNQMRDEAYLFLGAAETTMGLSTKLKRTTLGKATCYQLER